MESTILTNKIISIIVSLIVVTCVLIPICSSLGGQNGGEAGDDIVLSDMMDIRIKDNSQNRLYFEDADDYEIVLYPNHDSLTYKEGEIVALLSDRNVGSSNEPLNLVVTYHNGKLHVDSSNQSLFATGDYLAIRLYNADYYGDVWVKICSTESDLNVDMSWGTVLMSSPCGFAKYAGNNTDSNLLMYATNSPSVSLPTDNIIETLYTIPELQTVDDFLHHAFIHYAYYRTGSNGYMPSGPITMPTDSEEYEFGYCPESIAYYHEDSEQFLIDNKAKMQEPITLHQWDGYEFEDEYGTGEVQEFAPQYLIFNKNLDYTISGNGNNGSADNGTIGTLISMIPIFVILGILSALVIPMIRKENTI